MATELNQWEIEILRQAASASDGRVYTTCLDSDSGSTLPANIWARSLEAGGYLHLEYIDNIGGRYTITPAGQSLYNGYYANAAMPAAERSSDLLASVQTEAEDSGIVHDYREVIDGIQHFFDARPDVRRSFDLSSNVDEMLLAYVVRLETDLASIHAALRPFIAGGSEYSGVSGDLRAIREIGERGNRATERSLRLTGEMKTLKTEIARLEEENRALQAANQRLQDKLAEEARLHDQSTELRNEVEWLRAEAEAYLEVLQAIADDTLWTDARNATADVIYDYSPENTARPRRVSKGVEVDRLKAEVARLENMNNALLKALEKGCREFGRLADAASDVYDFEFEEDYSVHLRRLRRVMKACRIPFGRK